MCKYICVCIQCKYKHTHIYKRERPNINIYTVYSDIEIPQGSV